MASITKKNNGYLCRISCGFDGNGKRRTYTEMYHPKAKSESARRNEAQKYADQLEAQYKNKELLNIEKLTLNDFFERWREDIAGDYLTASKQEQYVDVMKNRFLNEIGNVTISEINALLLKSMVTDMKKEGLMPSSIRSYFTVLSSVMNKAYELGIIKENPVSRVTFPKVEQSMEIQTFDQAEAVRFLEALENVYYMNHKEHTRVLRSTGEQYSVPAYGQKIEISTMWKCYFTLAIFSGMRRGEMCALTWNDVDFESMSVSVTKSTAITKSGQIIKEPKTKAGYREIILPLPVIAKLKEWKREQERIAKSIGGEWTGESGTDFDQNFIFTQNNGKQVDVHTPTHKFKEIIRLYNSTAREEDKLPEIRLHDLRHCTASLLIGANMDAASVSSMLGHSKISMTLDRYTHALKGRNQAISNKLTELLSSNTGSTQNAALMA